MIDPTALALAQEAARAEATRVVAELVAAIRMPHDGIPGSPGLKGRDGLRGERGDPGLPGMTWRGAWSASTTYQPGDVVEVDGSSYVTSTGGRGTKPPAGAWGLVARKGDPGTTPPPIGPNAFIVRASGVDRGIATILDFGSNMTATVTGSVASIAAGAGGPAASGTVPVGGVIMWSGTLAAAAALTPTWAVCDGTANSPGPDLRDKFVVAASSDELGVAKTNIEGSLKASATQTGASVANHAALTHTNGAVGDHTGLTHDGAVASHPDLTHAALSHPAITVTHADHSVASASHTHASGADVSVASGTLASTAAISVPSGSFASHAAISVASGSFASNAAISVPSNSGASLANASVPAYATQSGVTITGTVTRSVITTGGLLLTLLSSGLGGNVSSYAAVGNASVPSHSHAAVTGSGPSGTVASSLGSAPSGTIASAANASGPSGSVASSLGSRPSATGSAAAVTLTHADHSIASLSHQAIGTHSSLTHAFTPPAGHGTAGTLTHAFTQPDAHAALTHSTVAIVPAYYALAFIQRMA